MEITHDTEAHQFIALNEQGDKIGEMEYSPHGTIISAIHTWTDDDYRGQGVAGQMLAAMVAYAEQNDLKIQPVCSYVVGAFEKHPEKYEHVRRQRS